MSGNHSGQRKRQSSRLEAGKQIRVFAESNHPSRVLVDCAIFKSFGGVFFPGHLHSLKVIMSGSDLADSCTEVNMIFSSSTSFEMSSPGDKTQPTTDVSEPEHLEMRRCV